MNKISYIFICLLILKATISNAQDIDWLKNAPIEELTTTSKALIIQGTLVDQQTLQPLEYAAISLFSAKDSSILGGAITQSDGTFKIETKASSFILKFEFFSYQSIVLDTIVLPEESKLNLGIIGMQYAVASLDGIEVRAERSSVMMQLDKRVFEVGSDLVSRGGTAEDVLRNVPGVWVDINGEVSLRSSGGVRILLDGQTSLLITGKNADGLRQIQASAIQRIEVITNPSARYEAEGMAGIINIILKKNQETGLNGALNANLGYPNNYGMGVHLNYMKDKVNLFGAMGMWAIDRPGTGYYRNLFYNAANTDSTIISNMNRTHNRHSKPLIFKAGADYYLNAKNTFTASVSYRRSNDLNTSLLEYIDATGQIENVDLRTERQEEEIGIEENLNGFFRHRKTFEQPNHQLTTDIQYEIERDDETALFDEYYSDNNYIPLDTMELHQVARNTSKNLQLLLKSDYIRPIGKNAELEAGFQSLYRRIGDDYYVGNIEQQIEYPDSNFVNDFQYVEDIHGVYANYGSKLKRFSYQAGLRVEYSHVVSTLEVEGGQQETSYVDFFPSLFMGYNLSDNTGVQLSYSRRIERPRFLDLTPFFTIRDRRNLWRGNPSIRPEYTHAFELGYMKYGDRGTFSAIAYFRITDDVIKRIQRIDTRFPESTLTQAENLDIKRNYGVECAYRYKLQPWWRLIGDFNFYHSFSEGFYEHQGKQIYVGGQSFSLKSKVINRFTLWKKLNTQWTFHYSAPRRTTQGINKSMMAVDFALSMDILNNDGTITFNVSDAFNTRRRRSFSEDETFYSEDNFLWQRRAVVLSFHYRINQHKRQSQIYSSPIKEEDEERY